MAEYVVGSPNFCFHVVGDQPDPIPDPFRLSLVLLRYLHSGVQSHRFFKGGSPIRVGLDVVLRPSFDQARVQRRLFSRLVRIVLETFVVP